MPRLTAWGWSAPRVGSQHNHAKSALRDVCSAVRRPLLHGTLRIRDARHTTRMRSPIPYEYSGFDCSLCYCGRASTDGVGRSVPRICPHHNHAKSTAQRVLRSPSAMSPWCNTRAGRAPSVSNALNKLFCPPRPSRPVAVSVWLSLDRRRGNGARRMFARNIVGPARRVIRGPPTATPWCDTRAGRTPRDSKSLAMACRPLSRRPVAVSVRSRLDCRRGDGARGALAHNTTTPSPRCAAFASRSDARSSMVSVRSCLD